MALLRYSECVCTISYADNFELIFFQSLLLKLFNLKESINERERPQ